LADVSGLTRAHIARLFAPEQQVEVERLLREECGENLALTDKVEDYERFHYAVLKLSEGSLMKLHEALLIAKRDWRDLLVWSGFGGGDHREIWPL
jgi:hypothetical protein